MNNTLPDSKMRTTFPKQATMLMKVGPWQPVKPTDRMDESQRVAARYSPFLYRPHFVHRLRSRTKRRLKEEKKKRQRKNQLGLLSASST